MKNIFVNQSMNLQKLIVALFLCALPMQKAQAQAQIDFLFQPLSQSVSVGADVIFLGMTFSYDPVTYQWRKNGQPIAAQTNDILYIPTATLTHAGAYDVVVTGEHGSVTS